MIHHIEPYEEGGAATPTQSIPVILAAISDNTNSLGLRGVILLSKEGRVWQIGVPGGIFALQPENLKLNKVHDLLIHPDGSIQIPFMFTTLEELPTAPPEVATAAWSNPITT